MKRKDSLDLNGVVGLVGFAVVLAFNQVVIKLMNGGFGPVFGAGVRSLLALVVLGLWIAFGRGRMGALRATLWPGLLLGLLFTFEFIFVFTAMDMTSVSRASITFYSMPIWLAIVAHFALPGEQLSRRRALGLGLAMLGVGWALADPHSRAEGDLRGDLLALFGSWCWAGIALTVRLTRVSELPASGQLIWQLGVSAVMLLALAPLMGPLWRDPGLLEWSAMGYGVLTASIGFTFWLWLMTIYPASDIASFSFLTPVLAVLFGWLVFGEPVGVQFGLALLLVAVGIVLINKRRR
ncbi:drug/metabolite transporter (DMT)-like permease [Sagittula marina]|uniref:Drug/metabolite transporter (DMT)-like permease n=1 Tax=Sagittula marina TaxID=943940 RepID=A0A7W6DTS6_9RHOB|nr:DMT family transporter [Sagittula marina]MBB3986772.1 drug/metabolite transporter (DMT)-like permease [Sagittula marina]